jgi:hypothetical protein
MPSWSADTAVRAAVTAADMARFPLADETVGAYSKLGAAEHVARAPYSFVRLETCECGGNATGCATKQYRDSVAVQEFARLLKPFDSLGSTPQLAFMAGRTILPGNVALVVTGSRIMGHEDAATLQPFNLPA